MAEVDAFEASLGIMSCCLNQTPSPIHVLRTSVVPIELVATIDPGKWLSVWTTGSDHLVFGSLNTRQPMLFTSVFGPDLSGCILKVDDTSVRGSVILLLSAPSEVSTLKDACVESVLTSVERSVAKIDQLPLPKPLIARVKDAAENPSDYVRAKEFITRYINSLP